jgi:hypothetical protein
MIGFKETRRQKEMTMARVYGRPWGVFIRDDDTRRYVLCYRYATEAEAQEHAEDLYNQGESIQVRFADPSEPVLTF